MTNQSTIQPWSHLPTFSPRCVLPWRVRVTSRSIMSYKFRGCGKACSSLIADAAPRGFISNAERALRRHTPHGPRISSHADRNGRDGRRQEGREGGKERDRNDAIDRFQSATCGGLPLRKTVHYGWLGYVHRSAPSSYLRDNNRL